MFCGGIGPDEPVRLRLHNKFETHTIPAIREARTASTPHRHHLQLSRFKAQAPELVDERSLAFRVEVIVGDKEQVRCRGGRLDMVWTLSHCNVLLVQRVLLLFHQMLSFYRVFGFEPQWGPRMGGTLITFNGVNVGPPNALSLHMSQLRKKATPRSSTSKQNQESPTSTAVTDVVGGLLHVSVLWCGCWPRG